MNKTLHYILDPLCGWCYGASAAVEQAAALPSVQVHVMPCGMFADDGSRPMDEAFASYAWANDQRIAQLTGQPFSETYRTQVLGNRQQRFDSGLASRALTAVALTAPPHTLQALKVIQHARYVAGEDVTRMETLCQLLVSLGLTEASELLHSGSAALEAAYAAETAQAQDWLQQASARGVPTFILEQNGRYQLMPNQLLFADAQAWLDLLQTR